MEGGKINELLLVLPRDFFNRTNYYVPSSGLWDIIALVCAILVNQARPTRVSRLMRAGFRRFTIVRYGIMMFCRRWFLHYVVFMNKFKFFEEYKPLYLKLATESL